MAKKKHKKSLGETAAAPAENITVKTKGGGGILVPLAITSVAGVLGFIAIKKLVAAHNENKAEGDSSPEADIATKLKYVFGNTPVDDAAYQTAAALITDSNRKEVYRIYKQLTSRNLSDDIGNHINVNAANFSDKIQKVNSKPGKTASITPEGTISFEIVKGDYVRFAPGQTTPITVYNSPFGLVIDRLKNIPRYPEMISKLKNNPKTVALTISVQIKPSAKQWPVVSTQEITMADLTKQTGFWSIVGPYSTNKNNIAALQIVGGTNLKTGKPVLVWVNAHDVIKGVKAVPVKKKGTHGLGTAYLVM